MLFLLYMRKSKHTHTHKPTQPRGSRGLTRGAQIGLITCVLSWRMVIIIINRCNLRSPHVGWLVRWSWPGQAWFGARPRSKPARQSFFLLFSPKITSAHASRFVVCCGKVGVCARATRCKHGANWFALTYFMRSVKLLKHS